MLKSYEKLHVKKQNCAILISICKQKIHDTSKRMLKRIIVSYIVLPWYYYEVKVRNEIILFFVIISELHKNKSNFFLKSN